MPINMKTNLQEMNTYSTNKIINLHDHMISMMILILIITTYWMIMSINNKMINLKENESNETEMFWTSTPMIMLMFMAMPSILMLYTMEEMIKPSMSIKIQGYQWYWEYEYTSNKMKKKINMYLENSKKIRLMKTNNPLILPSNMNIRLMVTSNDVIHSWSMPSTSTKIDAIPGRINQTNMNLIKPTVSYGQCSEICGMNHSFMPIMLMVK